MENKIKLTPSLNPYLINFNIAQKNLARWEQEVSIPKRWRMKQKPCKPNE